MLRTVSLKTFHLRCVSTAIIVLLVALAPPACTRSDDAGASGDVSHTSASNSTATAAPQTTLAAAAARLWDARVAENWAVVYEYQQFRQATDTTPEQFTEWSKKNEPFVIRNYTIERQVEDGDFGWVEVSYLTSVRQFPDVAPTQTVRTEKWQRLDGKWKLVPSLELDQYPAPPFARDLDAEKELRARFEQSWQARVDRDWIALYEMTDPADRKEISQEHFAEAQEVQVFLSYDLKWLEAVNNIGRLHLAITHKINDPNLTKLPPTEILIDEFWVKRDGQWYLDLNKGSSGT